MSCTSQNFRLFHVSNLFVRNFRIVLLMYTGSQSVPSTRPWTKTAISAWAYGTIFWGRSAGLMDGRRAGRPEATPDTWTDIFDSVERINFMWATHESFDSCNSVMSGSQPITWATKLKFPFVSHIEYIRSTLSIFSARVSGVRESSHRTPAARRPPRRPEPRWFTQDYLIHDTISERLWCPGERGGGQRRAREGNGGRDCKAWRRSDGPSNGPAAQGNVGWNEKQWT